MAEFPVRRLLAAVLVAGSLVACGAESEPPADRPEPTGTTTSTPTVTTTTAAPFTAADGRDLQACADGTCEVFVQTGDSLPNAGGGGPVRITVEAGSITIATTGDGMTSTMTGRPGMPQQVNNQVFDIVAVEGTQGLLRLSLV